MSGEELSLGRDRKKYVPTRSKNVIFHQNALVPNSKVAFQNL